MQGRPPANTTHQLLLQLAMLDVATDTTSAAERIRKEQEMIRAQNEAQKNQAAYEKNRQNKQTPSHQHAHEATHKHPPTGANFKRY